MEFDLQPKEKNNNRELIFKQEANADYDDDDDDNDKPKSSR